jgi:dUTP pyrophosphatase
MSLPNIKFKKLHKNAIVPTKGTPHSAAYDLYAIEDFYLCGESIKLVKLGFATEIPSGWCAKISPRSGLALKKGITIVNSPGIIDSDYRDEWGIIFKKESCLGAPEIAVDFKAGDRIAQVTFESCVDVDFEVVDELIKSNRTGGFGSTDE